MENIVDKAIEYIKDYFKNDFSGHDYYHSIRVLNNARNIYKSESGDLEIIELSSLLHDVDDYKLVGKQDIEYKNAKKFLNENNYPEDKIEKICHIISQVSFKGIDTVKPDTIEGMIVQDADRLDAIGAIGISRTFTYSGCKNRPIYDPNIKYKENMNKEEYYSNNGTAINHFYEKLLLLKDLMNTNSAKLIAENRHKYMEEFLNEFYLEWDGEK